MLNKKRGDLIVFEGADHMFKETNSKKLFQYIKEKYPEKNPKLISFPRYGHPAAYFEEKYLSRQYPPDITGDAVSCFYLLDQLDYMLTEGDDHLDDGNTLILDRYWYSDVIYRAASMFFKDRTRTRRDVNREMEKIAERAESILRHPSADIIFIMTADCAIDPKGGKYLDNLWAQDRPDINVEQLGYMWIVAAEYDIKNNYFYFGIHSNYNNPITRIYTAMECVNELGEFIEYAPRSEEQIFTQIRKKYEGYLQRQQYQEEQEQKEQEEKQEQEQETATSD